MDHERRTPLLDWMFDPEYRRHLNQATREVPLLHAMYLLCIPLGKALVWARCSPTTITHISNLLAACSVAALAWAPNPWLFPLLWLAALCFDIADGIVARSTGTASASGSFYDHMSDQLKVVALFCGAGLRYDTSAVWLLCYATCASFLFMSVVNQVRALRGLRLATRSTGTIPDAGVADAPRSGGARARLKSFLQGRPRLKKALLGVHASVFVMYGNSMLLVLPLGFGESWALATLVFFWFVTLRSILSSLAAASRVNRQLTLSGIPWK